MNEHIYKTILENEFRPVAPPRNEAEAGTRRIQRLRQLDLLLALMPEANDSRLVRFCEFKEQTLRRLEAAASRTDLTIREWHLLNRFTSAEIKGHRQLMVAEKARLEEELRRNPGH